MFGADFLEILTRSVALAAFLEPMDAPRNGPTSRANPAPRKATLRQDGWRNGLGG